MNEPDRTPAGIATAVVVVSVLLVAASVVSPYVAVLALSAFAAAGACARILAPTRRAFIVRRKATDVTVLLVLAGALAYLGLTTPLG